jgi:hypothetical protein
MCIMYMMPGHEFNTTPCLELLCELWCTHLVRKNACHLMGDPG